MTLYNQILLPTDGSDESGPAVTYALALAKLAGAEVTAMCVLNEGFHGDVSGVVLAQAEPVLYQKGLDAVGSVVSRGKARGVKVKPLVVDGVPDLEIVRASINYDLTVMGTAGRTGASHLLLGSVAEKVVRTARSHVLVVHSGVQVDADRPVVKRLLLPTDGMESTTPAIIQGLRIARLFGAEVTALSVAKPAPPSSSKNPDDAEPGSYEACRQAAQYVVDEGAKLGIAVEPVVLTGQPSQQIADLSSSYDLIVMGTAGRTGLAHIRLGSVAESTIRQAKCPVLVVRARGRRSEQPPETGA